MIPAILLALAVLFIFSLVNLSVKDYRKELERIKKEYDTYGAP